MNILAGIGMIVVGLVCLAFAGLLLRVLVGLLELGKPEEPAYPPLTAVKRRGDRTDQVSAYTFTVAPRDLPAVDREPWEEVKRNPERPT